MDKTAELAKVKDLVDSARNIIIATHEHPTFDSIGSMLTLALGLQTLGKNVTVCCPDPMTVELSSFVGVNKVTTTLPKKSFVISLDYVEGSIEKVSYAIEGNTFNLTIEPRPGFEPYTSDKAHYSYTGAAADVIFVVDTIHLGGLKKIHEEHGDLFSTQPIINIDRHANNAKFGQVNIVDSALAATVELIAQVLSILHIKLTPDLATNTLNALYSATNSFQSPQVNGRTFELASLCLRAGGKRFSQSADAGESVPTASVSHVAPMNPVPVPSSDAQKTHEEKHVPDQPSQQSPPSDWLKPKIFKSSQG